MKTYLELVNQVLVAMRESEVSDVTQNNYTKMIAKFINDAKQQCEDANNWEANLEVLTLGTITGNGKVSLTGKGQRGTIDTVVSTTNSNQLQAVTRRKMQEWSRTTAIGVPSYYANNGVDFAGDSVLSMYPFPSSGQELEVSGWFRQKDLKDNSDKLRIPHRCVVELAIALAVRERGELAGQATGEYFEIAKRTLSDAIQYDSAKSDDEDVWYVEGKTNNGAW